MHLNINHKLKLKFNFTKNFCIHDLLYKIFSSRKIEMIRSILLAKFK